ncbi:MAG: ATP-binding cassette domain-containing protein [Rhodobacterales bacterium]|nr:ATP-binding cassette domain-containing protein [Rhodobacterales bacterium]MDX5498356.1 ATP-binding cassette domain-containing protein [Rhodobacterales bacterium]
MTHPSDTLLLAATGLTKRFQIGGGSLFRAPRQVHAVDDVSLSLATGETLGIVGESGCGKSTLSRLLMRLIEPTAGSIHFRGQDLMRLSPADLRRARRDMQIVFQDPFGSLNPRMTVRQIVDEPLRVHGQGSRADRDARIVEALQVVGLGAHVLDRHPHEFSGGQRQRIGIARAMVLNPALLIGDEPVSALDVSVRAQILNLLRRIQSETGVGFVIVSHDLGAIRYICHRVAVMYLGRVVEEGPVEQIFRDPQHPYTRTLISAVPVPRVTDRGPRLVVQGEIPSPLAPPQGCHFHTRCPFAMPVCRQIAPALTEIAPGRRSACHLHTQPGAAPVPPTPRTGPAGPSTRA